MKKIKKILKLNKKANKIWNDDNLSWKFKYDLIFSEEISRKVFKLTNLDYYDPDCDYDDDVNAFMLAFNDWVDYNLKNGDKEN